jgi:hypothetical protein
MRWIVDKLNPPKESDSESSPGVLLCSGYIAGGSLVGVLAAFLNFRDDWVEKLNMAPRLDKMFGAGFTTAQWTTVTAFGIMMAVLFMVGISGRYRKVPEDK